MKVLSVTAMYPTPTDPARGSFVMSQLRSLEQAGVNMEVLRLPVGGGPRAYVEAVQGIGAAVRRVRPDLIHAHYGLVGWSSMWQRTPTVTSFCGDDLLGTPRPGGGLTGKSRVGMLMSQWAARRSRGIICKSEELRSRIRDRAARARAIVVPNGVDITVFAPGSRAEARVALDIDPDAPIVLFPNTPTEPRKRLDLAQAAMQIVQRRIPGARLQLLQKVAHSQMPLYYRASNVVLLTSDWEGSPNAVKEALLTGVPVVSTDVGDVREWIMPSNGVVAASRDPGAIAEGITRMLEQPAQVDVAALRERLASDRIAARIISYYERVIAGQVA